AKAIATPPIPTPAKIELVLYPQLATTAVTANTTIVIFTTRETSGNADREKVLWRDSSFSRICPTITSTNVARSQAAPHITNSVQDPARYRRRSAGGTT